MGSIWSFFLGGGVADGVAQAAHRLPLNEEAGAGGPRLRGADLGEGAGLASGLRGARFVSEMRIVC